MIAIAWVYGADNFIENIKEMLPEEKTFGLDLKNSRANWIFWKIMWQYVTPVTLFVILIWSLIDIKPSQYGNQVFLQLPTQCSDKQDQRPTALSCFSL